MKMKLNFLTKLLVSGFLAFCAFAFVACSEDDDDDDSTTGLTPRDGGVNITENAQLDGFFAAFQREFETDEEYYEEYLDYANGDEDEWKYRVRGRKSGTFAFSQKVISYEETSDGGTFSGTQTLEYRDYSNEGVLFFGGKVVQSVSGYSKMTETDFEEVQNYTINGKINFNGAYKGTLDFQNFKIKARHKHFYYDGYYVDESLTIDESLPQGGKIMLGTLDVTDNVDLLSVFDVVFY
ncbi:MAG: hypothetical protein FWF51_09520 [Chitinivibrionia bacterium]|nr:hypothetical protein [Chitinivibrionia bacterium]